MAGLLPSFASGSNLAIYIGNVRVAYGSNISFVDDVSHQQIGGIGSYNYDAIEPTQYMARGSFSVTRYSDLARTAITSTDVGGVSPARSAAGTDTDGNSMLHPSQFNPTDLLLSKTFDIKIYERKSQTAAGDADMTLTFTLKDCRMTGYSIGFTPGSIVSENINFMCILAVDEIAQGRAE